MRHDDEEIKKNIVDQIYLNSKVNAADVMVVVSDGLVKLAGTVPTLSAKAAASDSVWLVSGVRFVENDLKVACDTDKECFVLY